MYSGTDKSAGELNFDQALRKAADYCAGNEHCESELRYKLQHWGIDQSYLDRIIESLTSQGFIDDCRYAINLTGSKFRLFKWGKIKIKAELRQKMIKSEFISKALDGLDPEDYKMTALTLLNKKLLELRINNRENRNKAASYLIGKGFEPELVFSLLNHE